MAKYDAVIIGSGLGGLCTAYILAKHGMKVCVLEKNRQVGGSLQIYSRDKTIFETGVHYLGGLEEGQNLHSYFKYFNILNGLKLQKLDEDGFDVISFEGDEQHYPHAQGYDNFIERLAAIFPHEREALKLYIQKVRETCADFPMYNLSSNKKDFTNAWHLQIDSQTFINSIFKDPKLQKVIGGNNMLYAGVAGKSPFYVHALVVNSYIESSYRCIDGSSQIAKIMSNNIKAMGGEILNYHEATRFNFNGDNIESVELTTGERVEGKTFVSAIDLAKTIDMVDGPQLRTAYKNRLKNLESTVSAFLLNVVVKPNALEHLNHNIYHLRNHDVWAGPFYEVQNWPESVAVFGNTNSKNPAYTENFTAMGYMRFDECEKWWDTKSIIPNNINYRGDDYEAFKIEKSEKLLDLLEARMPGIRSKVQSYTSATPITYRDYIGSKDGSLYGAIKDYKEPLKTFITPRTKVNNLFLTGQNLNLHGVLGVTVSSVVTCTEILGDPFLIDKIRECK